MHNQYVIWNCAMPQSYFKHFLSFLERVYTPVQKHLILAGTMELCCIGKFFTIIIIAQPPLHCTPNRLLQPCIAV